jgi:hypothetical protein
MTGSHYVTQAGLVPLIILPLPGITAVYHSAQLKLLFSFLSILYILEGRGFVQNVICFNPYFMTMITEAQRGVVTCTRSHGIQCSSA